MRKSKLIIVSCQLYNDAVLYINNQPIEKTNKFKYLGRSSWQVDEEVKIRMTITKTIFFRFHKYFLWQEMRLSLRLHVIKCYV